MGIKSFLSQREKKELLEFLAATGENYDRYIEWCQQHGAKPFSRKYLHTWLQRRRPEFKQIRERQKEELRRLSMYDREKRIETLERDLDLLNSQIFSESHECSKCGQLHFSNPEMIIKIAEQKRKISEAIAKERNEWLKPQSDERDELSARNRLRSSIAQMLNEGKQTTIVDGKIIVAED